jgi:hypothetical protein
MNDLEEKRALYPRVSDIIGKQNAEEFRSIPLDVLANACIRGQKVHDYCTAWIKDLWIPDVESEYKPYVESFTEWASNHISEHLFSAVRLYDDDRMFSGEFDMIVKLKNGETALLDIKTSAASSKTWPLQLAAYAHLCQVNGFCFNAVYNIHLKKNPSTVRKEKQGEKISLSLPAVQTREIRYDDLNSYWRIFSSALECYDYFNRKEVK